MGLPGYGAVLMSRVPWSYTPPGSLPPSPTSCGRRVVAFEQFSALVTQYVIDFVAAFPTAHALARLRFAGRVTAPVARLATGSGGLTPGQAGFAPAYRLTFSNLSLHSIPLDQHCLVAQNFLSAGAFLLAVAYGLLTAGFLPLSILLLSIGMGLFKGNITAAVGSLYSTERESMTSPSIDSIGLSTWAHSQPVSCVAGSRSTTATPLHSYLPRALVCSRGVCGCSQVGLCSASIHTPN